MHKFFRYTSPVHFLNFGISAVIAFAFVGGVRAAEPVAPPATKEAAREDSLKLLHDTLKPQEPATERPDQVPPPAAPKPPKPVEQKKPPTPPKAIKPAEQKKPAPPKASKPAQQKQPAPPKAPRPLAPVEPLPLPEEAIETEVPDDALFDYIDPQMNLELPTEGEGYYPTIEETMLLGGDYPRSIGGGRNNNPPDRRMQLEQGIYPYPNPGQGNRAPWAESLSPLNPFLGFFAERQAYVTPDGPSWPRGMTLDLDSSFPLLVREFSPERAMLKVGPTYFDLLFVGMTVLYSDYEGDQVFAGDSEDGWLIGVEFGLRGLVQFTDQFYLSLAATVVYLPLENDIGIRLGSGGTPTAIASINYQFERGSWDVHIYNNFHASSGLDIFANIESGAIDRAGRYSFGFGDGRDLASGYYDGDNAYFVNALGIEASTPVLEDWRLWLSAKSLNAWRTMDFEDHNNVNSLGVRLGYNGSALRFAPYLEYNLDHYNEDDRLANRIYVGMRGRLTENLSMIARAGYLWWDNNGNPGIEDGYLYSVGLYHELTRYTSHALTAGQDFYNDDLTGDSTMASYIRYAIDHTFSRSLTGVAAIQYSELEYGFNETDMTSVTGSLRYALHGGLNSYLLLRAAYEHRSGAFNIDRWLGRASYTRNLFSRTRGELFYQYEEASGDQNFNEHLFGLTLREYF